MTGIGPNSSGSPSDAQRSYPASASVPLYEKATGPPSVHSPPFRQLSSMNERERALALLDNLKTLIGSPVWQTLGAEEKSHIIARLIGAVEVTRSKIFRNVETLFIQQRFSFTRKGNRTAGPYLCNRLIMRCVNILVSLQRLDGTSTNG